MRVEFNQGVPQECVDWLWENVGPGNIYPNVTGPLRTFPTAESDAWVYERMEVEIKSTDPSQDSNVRYVPTITVKDEKLAMLFMLRWA